MDDVVLRSNERHGAPTLAAIHFPGAARFVIINKEQVETARPTHGRYNWEISKVLAKAFAGEEEEVHTASAPDPADFTSYEEMVMEQQQRAERNRLRRQQAQQALVQALMVPQPDAQQAPVVIDLTLIPTPPGTPRQWALPGAA